MNTPPANTFPLAGILGLILITLKLCGVINWSWWYITAPFWGGFAISLGFASFMAVMGGLVVLVTFLAALLQKRK